MPLILTRVCVRMRARFYELYERICTCVHVFVCMHEFVCAYICACMQVCVSMHAHFHICVWTYMCRCARVCECACTCLSMHVFMSLCTQVSLWYARVYAFKCTCLCACTQAFVLCTCLWVCMHVFVSICTQVSLWYAHVYTFVCTCFCAYMQAFVLCTCLWVCACFSACSWSMCACHSRSNHNFYNMVLFIILFTGDKRLAQQNLGQCWRIYQKSFYCAAKHKCYLCLRSTLINVT